MCYDGWLTATWHFWIRKSECTDNSNKEKEKWTHTVGQFVTHCIFHRKMTAIQEKNKKSVLIYIPWKTNNKQSFS